MTTVVKLSGNLGSFAEDLFVELFCETFGPEKTEYLYIQYPCADIYGNMRFIDFALESQDIKLAIEIDGETYHNPYKVSNNKYYDDLTKQNSLIYNNWKVYRWVYNQLKNQPEKVKDELRPLLARYRYFRWSLKQPVLSTVLVSSHKNASRHSSGVTNLTFFEYPA